MPYPSTSNAHKTISNTASDATEGQNHQECLRSMPPPASKVIFPVSEEFAMLGDPDSPTFGLRLPRFRPEHRSKKRKFDLAHQTYNSDDIPGSFLDIPPRPDFDKCRRKIASNKRIKDAEEKDEEKYEQCVTKEDGINATKKREKNATKKGEKNGERKEQGNVTMNEEKKAKKKGEKITKAKKIRAEKNEKKPARKDEKNLAKSTTSTSNTGPSRIDRTEDQKDLEDPVPTKYQVPPARTAMSRPRRKVTKQVVVADVDDQPRPTKRRRRNESKEATKTDAPEGKQRK